MLNYEDDGKEYQEDLSDEVYYVKKKCCECNRRTVIISVVVVLLILGAIIGIAIGTFVMPTLSASSFVIHQLGVKTTSMMNITESSGFVDIDVYCSVTNKKTSYPLVFLKSTSIFIMRLYRLHYRMYRLHRLHRMHLLMSILDTSRNMTCSFKQMPSRL